MRRAIGIVRVSQTKGREGESFHSPTTQRERIEAAAAQHGWRLLDVHAELDVSGGRRLDERAKLLAAVEAIEAGRADVLAAAYLDRLTRDPGVRDEIVSRVEAAGGQVWTVDMGRQTNGTAAEQLTGTLASAVHRYVRRVNAEKSAEAQQRAINRGVPPWGGSVPGYVRGADNKLHPDPTTMDAVEEAFRMRAAGASIAEVRAHLAAHGIERTHSTVARLLASRVYLGQIHFGDYEPNLSAHSAIVEPGLWQRVQRVKVPRGRKAKSPALLARLGILACAACGARMVTDRGHGGRFYRCPSSSDCPGKATISAEAIEDYVERVFLAGVRDLVAHGTEQHPDVALLAEEAREAQAALDGTIAAFTGLETEPAAIKRLAELRDARDRAQKALEQARDAEALPTLHVGLVEEWPNLTVDEKRALLQAGLEAVTVRRGRAPVAERVTANWRGSVLRPVG